LKELSEQIGVKAEMICIISDNHSINNPIIISSATPVGWNNFDVIIIPSSIIASVVKISMMNYLFINID